MADSFSQEWTVYRYADTEIVLTGTGDASGFALAAEIAADPGADVALAVTPTADTTTITVSLTAAQMTDPLTADRYYLAVWRTDAGSKKPLAAGWLSLVTTPAP